MFGEVGAKFVEVMLPTRSPLGDPLLGSVQHNWLNTASAHPPNLLRSDEAARLQHLKVLNNCWKRHRKWLGELLDRRRSLTQALHYDPPGRVCQRVEDEIKRDIIVKHVLNYNGERGICQVLIPRALAQLALSQRREFHLPIVRFLRHMVLFFSGRSA